MHGLVRSGLVTAAILGAATSVATAAPLLKVSFKTTPIGQLYAPANVVAAWIEDDAGVFVKTIGRWAGVRKDHLVGWQNMAGTADADAVSGATRLDHGATLMVEWDLKDKDGLLVPDGLYTIRLETADGNSTTEGQNWQGEFTFTKGLMPDVQMPLDPSVPPHYTDVSIHFDPIAGECNNSVVDPGETCDPPGSCPTTCDQSATDSCAPNVMVGSIDACTAACVITAITACANDDGCCVEGCSPFEDNDCSQEDIEGGCATGGGSDKAGLLAFALIGALTLFGRRRRA